LALPPDAECGALAVAENRTSGVGRKLRLNVVTFPALDAERGRRKPPVFFLAGGPGDAAASNAAGLASYLGGLRTDRDLVFVDIRGTGRSAPLFCQPLGPPDQLQTYMKYLLDMDDVRSCRAELEKSADLTQYTTSYAADDINAVRAALGYEKMALFGGSYGTRLAQEIMRRHPDRVELAVLLGVAPPSLTAPSGFARAQQEALDRLIELCSADPDCRSSYPHFADQLDEVLDRVSSAPATATIEHPNFEHPQAVSLTRGEFVMGLRFLAYRADLAARFPQLIASAAQGDYAPILGLISLAYYDIRQNFFMGLYYSMTCAEDLPFVDIAREEESSAGTALGMYRMQQQLDACEIWPQGEADPLLHEPLTSNVPVLLISGELDPVTPTANGDLVARTLSRSLHMVLAHRGHGALDEAAVGCWLPALVEFARTSSLDNLDISCARQLDPLPFSFTPPS
jgi:pimeloyl-ACP methyl ester carboxylesterase